MFHGGFQSRFLLLPMKNRDSRQSGLFNKVCCFCRTKPPPTPPNLGGERYRRGANFCIYHRLYGSTHQLNYWFQYSTSIVQLDSLLQEGERYLQRQIFCIYHWLYGSTHQLKYWFKIFNKHNPTPLLISRRGKGWFFIAVRLQPTAQLI